MSLAIVVIASEKRLENTLVAVIRSVADQVTPPGEFLVVGEGIHGADFPFFNVAPITRTTIDALVKRDVGWAATTAHDVLFLCDDHRLPPDFVETYYRRYGAGDWDILAPSRFVMRPGYEGRYPLNVGRDLNYVGGHAGIYRRRCAHLLPWSAGPHHRNWDVLHTHQLIAKGARLQYADTDLAVEDIEGGTPWV